MMRYVEMFEGKVVYIGTTAVLPVLTPPFSSMDISDYDGPVEYGYTLVDGKFVKGEDVPEPVEPTPIPVETFEEKMEKWMAVKDANDLVMLDSVLGVYEEIYKIKEELIKLKTGGTTNG